MKTVIGAPAFDQKHDLRFRLCVLLSTLVLAVFLPASRYAFVNFDDPEYILRNPLISHGLNPNFLIPSFWSTYAGNWHPLTWISHALDIQLFGYAAGAHHLTNVWLHAANSVLVFCLLVKLFPDRLIPAFFSAAFFGLHPLRVESVAWVSERKDILCALFFLASVYLYLSRVHDLRRRDSIAVGALSLLALMSKPMAVSLPLFLVVLFWFFSGVADRGVHKFRNHIALLVALVMIDAVICLVTLKAQSATIRSIESVPVGMRASNALISYMIYFFREMYPRDLCAFYPFGYHTFSDLFVFLAAVGVVAAIYLAFKYGNKITMLGTLWYFATLLPVIGIVQVGAQANADRYTYIPSIGLSILVCFYLSNSAVPRRFLILTGTAAVLVLVVGTRFQMETWRDSFAMWGNAAQVCPRNWLAYENLGVLTRAQKQYGISISYFKSALKIHDQCDTRFKYGYILETMGLRDAAQAQYRQTLMLPGDHAGSLFRLAAAAKTAKKTDDYLQFLTRAVNENPKDVEALCALSYAYLEFPSEREKYIAVAESLAKKASLLSRNLDSRAVEALIYVAIKKKDWQIAETFLANAFQVVNANDLDSRERLEALTDRIRKRNDPIAPGAGANVFIFDRLVDLNPKN